MIKINELEQLPLSNGIYKFYDKDKNILYIGKATNLKSRVSSYFHSDHFDRPRIIGMIPLIEYIDYVQTNNDIESLVLESALVKEQMPKYNSALKDDKSYAWIYINTKDKYPTVKIVRTIEKSEFKRGQLFGPYPSGRAIKRVFSYLRKLYPFCTAKDNCMYKKSPKGCFHSRINLCPGPNASDIQYKENIDNIIKFLKGRNSSHIKELEKEMIVYSKNQDFEKAAILRDKITDLKYLGSDINYTYFKSEQEYLEDVREKSQKDVNGLAKELNIENANRIECYDISNIQGKMSFGSMTVAIDGTMDKSMYRIFKIKEDGKADDPEMLREVLTRRLKHIGNDSTDVSLNTKPDVILIDGGNTQLGNIYEVVPSNIKVIGISKGKYLKRAGQKKVDEFWDNRSGIWLKMMIKNKKILINLRDEAHRFAILHHRKLRGRLMSKSQLDSITGVGVTTRKKLIKAFGDVDTIKLQSIESIDSVIKNKKISTSIYEYFKK